MNPLADVHIHPQPEALPIDLARIQRITVRCPVRGRGLVVHALAAPSPLFDFFVGLVASHGELALDSDAPLVDALVDLGFLVPDDEVIDWPQLAIPLPAGPPVDRDAPWRVAPSLRFQPAFALHPDLRWPADYDEQAGRLRCFAPGPALWLGDPASLVSPFWLTPDEAAVVAHLQPGAPLPEISQALLASLASIGAVLAAPPRDPHLRLAGYRAAYQADGFAIAHDLLPDHELAALRRYYGALLAADLIELGDHQSARRYSAYNDPVGRFVHARLAATMSALAARPVEPSFSYFFAYLEGADLEPHKDRPQAEYSISLQLDHTPAPAGPTGWPLRFTFDDGRAASADLALGDAVLYHGRAVTHFRTPLATGQRSSLLVLEYVPLDFPGLRI